MRFLRSAILAIGFMTLAAACGGKQAAGPAEPAANPCAAANPCGEANPCAAANPCGAAEGGEEGAADAPADE